MPPEEARDGAIMAIVLILVLVFSTLGLGLLQLSTGNATDTSKNIDRTRAFWAAEAGLEEARAAANLNRSRSIEDSEPFCFPPYLTWLGTNAMLQYQVEITDQGTVPPSFHVRSLGHSPGGMAYTLAIRLQQTNALPLGLFAVNRLTLSHAPRIRSFDSSFSFNPQPSLKSAAVGANGRIDLPANPADLDIGLRGILYQGIDPHAGNIATLNCEPNCHLFPVEQKEINPDPLGIFPPGPLAQRFDSAGFWAEEFVVAAGETNILSSDRYIHDLILETNATLIVNVSDGDPVNVFLTGSFLAGSGSRIEVNPGPPSHFRIFANGATLADRIDLHTHTGLGLFIYAPGLHVDIETDGDFRGGAWGRDLNIQVPGKDSIFIDRQLMTYDAFAPWPMYRLAFTDWERSPASP